MLAKSALGNRKLIAILGASGSGKSSLALKIAEKIDAEIFSLDSLSIYKQIDIASAKPKKEELKRIRHYGIDCLNINEHNNAVVFKNLLNEALKTKKTLLIVGGSSFYLKSIIDGLSPVPLIQEELKSQISFQISSLKNPYEFLEKIDKEYAKNIKFNDSYRIHKALEIYFSTSMTPNEYFKLHPKEPFELPIKTYCIQIDRDALKNQIFLRTKSMIKEGIIDEIESLLKKYPKTCQPFSAIGPKECILYLENKIKLTQLEELINTHTSQLAKRQTTFNKTQFKDIEILSKEDVFDSVLRFSAF